MKKIMLLTFLLLLMHSSAPAQLLSGFGLKIGKTYANQDFNYPATSSLSFETEQRSGNNFGFFVDLLDLPFIGAVGEVWYNQKGMKYEVLVTQADNPDGSGSIRIFDNRIDYLSLGLFGKVKMSNPVFSPYIFGGPRWDLQVNKKVDISREDIYDELKKSTAGITVGAGLEVGNLLPFSFLAEVLYNQDTANIFESDNLKIKNRSYELKFGIHLK